MNKNAIFLVFRKIFVCLVMVSFCFGGYAETYTMRWLNEDGTVNQTTTCNAGDDLILPTPPTKTGYTFAGWRPNYTQVEYLESSGFQYIDSGIIADQDTKVITEMEKISGGWLFGVRLSVLSRAFAVHTYYNSDTDKFFMNYGTEYAQQRYSQSRNIFTMDKNKFYVDGVLVKTFTYKTFTTPGSIYLYNCNTGNGALDTSATQSVRIYWLQIYDNETLVRDFIPVLDKNDVPCMYDRVSNKMFYNQGAGQFVAGPEKQ